jgi:eukaryotic-like serine/threonine-protein kinase
MADVRLELEEALSSLDDPAPRSASTTARPGLTRLAWAAGLALAMLGVAGGWWLATRPSSVPPGQAIRAEIDFPGRPSVGPLGSRHLAISADGSRLVIAAYDRLWIRRVDETAFVEIANGFGSNPFFSPDGDWVAGFTDRGLVKVPAGGGATVTIAASSDRPLGGAWARDGTIVFATSEALFQVPEDGGAVTLLMRPDRSRGELLYAWPELLPDASAVLVTIVPPNGAEGGFQVVQIDLKTLTRTTVLRAGSAARYVGSGHLVYASGRSLHVVRFDPVSGTTQGTAIALPDIDCATAADNGAANFAVSDTGTLVYTNPPQLPPRTLQWVDRAGLSTPLEIAPDNYVYPRVSPDGRRAAIERTIRGNRDIWIVDLARLTLTQLTDGPTEDMMPLWSADGQRVFFASRRAGNFDVYSQAADGATGAKVEFAGPDFQTPVAVTPDGRQVIVYERFQDLSLLDLAKPDRLQPLLHGPADERLADISPDGRWIAYESSESGGGDEIILRSFPNVNDRREKISVSGGRYPVWGPKGSDRLYYQGLDGRMMAVPIRLSPTLTIGTPVPLFTWQRPPAGRSGLQFHLSPVDGRFLMTKPTETRTGGPTTISLVTNWPALLDRRTAEP